MTHFDSWLSGFVDGEGSFHVHKGVRGIRCQFQIHLRADDLEILERIRTHLGVGTVNVYSRTDSNPVAMYHVFRKEDCLTLIKFFDSFPLQAKKARDYELWRQAVLLHAQVQRGRDNIELIASILKLAQQLKTGRKYSN